MMASSLMVLLFLVGKQFNESDMILKPDLTRKVIDPFTSHNTLVLVL